MKSPKLFISYSHDDVTWVRPFADELKQQGVQVWLDLDRIPAGASLDAALERGLRDCEAVAFVLGKSTRIDSPTLMFEIGAALGGEKRLLPIVEPGVPVSHLPLDLRKRRWIV